MKNILEFKNFSVSLKNDKKIDLTNYKNLEYLDLSGSSYLETIDLTKLKELKYKTKVYRYFKTHMEELKELYERNLMVLKL